MNLRLASADDLGSICEIYNPYVISSRATFDEVAVSIDDRRPWFDQFGASGPYRLVVADDRDVRGYACSMPFRSHPAFSETVEFSVYAAPSHTGQGLGARLYSRLLDELESAAVHRVMVGIALPNDASIALHHRFGFEDVGVFDEYAQK